MEEQARQSSEQERKHTKQMAVLIEQVKIRDAEMEHLIGSACDGAKAHSTPVASFQPFDLSSEPWLDYMERFRTFLTVNFISKEKEAQVFLTSQTTVTYNLLSNLVARQSPAKGVNDLSMDDIQKFMEEQFNPRRFVVIERYKFWSDLKQKPEETLQELVNSIWQDKARIRVCSDYSVTVNSQLETHHQPIPFPEDLMRNL